MCEVWWESVLMTILTPHCLAWRRCDIVQVEAVWIGIQFHRDFVFGGRGQYCVHVEGIGIAAELDASGGVSDEGSVGILDRLEQSLGHLSGLLIEDRVHAGDDDIQLREDIVGEIEIAIRQDVDFDASKDGNAVDVLVGGANSGDVFDRTFVVESVGEGQVLGVVSDGHVLIAARFGSLGHLFDGIAPVGLDGVHVDVALQIGLGKQLREGVIFREIDLTQILAHLRWDIVEVEFGVNLFFRFAGNGLRCLLTWLGCIR